MSIVATVELVFRLRLNGRRLQGDPMVSYGHGAIRTSREQPTRETLILLSTRRPSRAFLRIEAPTEFMIWMGMRWNGLRTGTRKTLTRIVRQILRVRKMACIR